MADDGSSPTDTEQDTSSLPALLAALASGARAVHGLPLEDDFAFESSFPEYSKALGETQESLLHTLTMALQHTSGISDDGGAVDDMMFELESFRDINDPLLWDACADACEALLDQVESFIKSDSGIVDDENVSLATCSLTNLAGRARQRAKSTLGRLVDSTVDMEKPQVSFEIDTTSLNDRTELFVPKVHPAKPFSVSPLDLTPQPGHGLETRYGPLRSNARVSPGVIAPSEHILHLYETEITSFEHRPWQLEATKPEEEIQVPSSLEATWVDTVEGLEELSRKLEKVREVAIDLEHHSYRSFAGLLCLMQISFRNPENKDEMENFLVDVFPLWNNINSHLAPMFANPDIVKVMHGADSDVQWLQRDLGIFVVNLFDTGRAARALSLSSAGLAFALQKYANVQADKTHQMSDWRQRPLPDAMRQYAIMDTHYLLDIYDRMRWDLIDHADASIEDVLDTSRQVCLIRYAKDPFNPQGYKALIKQRNSGRQQRTELNAQQEQVLEKLWDWRDQTARSCDESPVFVCSNAILLRVSLALPTTVTALQALLNPIPPLLLHYATSVTQIVRKVRTNVNKATPLKAAPSPGAETPDSEAQQRMSEQPAVGVPSSAFFKPAPRASDDRVLRSGVLSPVMGTEALYKQAGWTTPLGGSAREEDESRRRFMRRLVEEQEVEPIASTEEEEDSDVVVDDGRAPSTSSTNSKPRNLLAVNRANKDYKAQQSTSHSMGMGKDANTAESPSGQSRARTVDGMGAARAAREHSQSPVPGLSVEDEAKMSQQNAAAIRSGLSKKEELLGLISQSTDPDEDDLDEEDTPQRVAAPAIGGGANEDDYDGEGDNDEEFVIPRSMREIYKISNRNRRNKKATSPTPDRLAMPSSEVEMEHLAAAENLIKERGLDGKGYFDSSLSPKRQRTKSTGTEHDDSSGPGSRENSFNREDDAAFMQEIGWINSRDEVDHLLGQGTEDAGAGNNDGAAGDNDYATTPIPDDETAGRWVKGGRDSKTPTRDTKTPTRDTKTPTRDTKTPTRDTKTPTRDTKTPTFDYSTVGAMGLNAQVQQANPFFAGAAMVGGALARAEERNLSGKPGSNKKSTATKGAKQNRNRQERPEKRDGKTHAYRKR